MKTILMPIMFAVNAADKLAGGYVVTPDMINVYNTIVTNVAAQFEDKNGNPRVRLNLANGKSAVVLKSALKAQGALHPVQAIGAEIEISFYKAGAPLINGTVAQTDDFIVQSFGITSEAISESVNTASKELLKEQMREEQASDNKAEMNRKAQNSKLRDAREQRAAAIASTTGTPSTGTPTVEAEPIAGLPTTGKARP